MATINWTGNALDVVQVDTITVANTWAAGDTATVTINGKDLIYTVGTTGTSTTAIAAGIKEMFMSAVRLDGSSATNDGTSNGAGQLFGEFRELSASVSGSVVTVIGNTAGKPFTMTATEVTVGSGTATRASSQAATGKGFWDNGDNWSGGSVPANNDIVVFKDSSVSVKYGLPNASLEVTFQVWMSYTGEIGLPPTNRDDPSYPYYEYRQRYVRLDDAGAGTNIAHRFGIGTDGTGPTLINLKHSTLKCSPVVYNTGQVKVPDRAGSKVLNLCCTDNTSTLNILNGSVDFSSQDGSTSAFLTVIQSGGDSRGITAIHTSASTLTLFNGTMLIGGAGAITAVNVRGGTLRLESQTGTITGLSIYTGGTVDYASTATITGYFSFGGTFDARNSPGFTITSASVYPGSKFYDPIQQMTVGTSYYLYFDPSPDLQFGASLTGSRIKVV